MRYRNIFTTAAFIKRARRKAKEEDGDLLAASRKLLKEVLIGYALYYGFFLVLTVGILAVFGFTNLLGGPFVLAQVILFLLVGTLIIAAFGLWWLWSKIKQKIQSTDNTDIHEGSVVDGRLDD